MNSDEQGRMNFYDGEGKLLYSLEPLEKPAEKTIGQLLPSDQINFFGTGFSTGIKYGTEVMRITRDGVWVNPDVTVDDTAKAVLQALEANVEVLVQRAVQDEREKVANWMMQRGYATGHGDTTEDLLQELEWQVRENEREACAKVVEQAGVDGYGTLAAALLVRERGAP